MAIKKKEKSKKKEKQQSLEDIIKDVHSLTLSDIPKVLTAIIQGKIKDYGTMEATADVKLKCLKELKDFLVDNEVITPPKDITIKIEDMNDEERINEINKNLFGDTKNGT